jgi:hypothetical protein
MTTCDWFFGFSWSLASHFGKNTFGMYSEAVDLCHIEKMKWGCVKFYQRSRYLRQLNFCDENKSMIIDWNSFGLFWLAPKCTLKSSFSFKDTSDPIRSLNSFKIRAQGWKAFIFGQSSWVKLFNLWPEYHRNRSSEFHNSYLSSHLLNFSFVETDINWILTDGNLRTYPN